MAGEIDEHPRIVRCGKLQRVKLAWEQVRAFRARRHRLDKRAPRAAMLRVAGEICGLHAQVLSSAELSLWARVEGLPREAVQRALWKDGTLVKTWAMRGTLHLLPRAELPVFIGALSTYTHFLKHAWLKYFGVTSDELEMVIAALAKVLPGCALTREELAEAVAAHTGSAKNGAVLRQSWGVMLKPAAFRGQLCFAQGEPPRVRFTHPGRIQAMPSEQALRELARRYLSAYGPATRADFSSWWGESAAQSQRLLESLDPMEVEIDGERAYLLPGDAREAARAKPEGMVRLLPAFDPYVVGAPRRGGLFPLKHKARIYRPQGWISPALLVDGGVAGLWRHERSGRGLSVRLEPFARLTKPVRAAAAEEAERLAAFLGLELVEFR